MPLDAAHPANIFKTFAATLALPLKPQAPSHNGNGDHNICEQLHRCGRGTGLTSQQYHNLHYLFTTTMGSRTAAGQTHAPAQQMEELAFNKAGLAVCVRLGKRPTIKKRSLTSLCRPSSCSPRSLSVNWKPALYDSASFAMASSMVLLYRVEFGSHALMT